MAPTAPVSPVSTTHSWTVSTARAADGHAGSGNFGSGCFHGEAFLFAPSEEGMTSHHMNETRLSLYNNTVLPPADVIIPHHELDLGEAQDIWQEEEREGEGKVGEKEFKTKKKRPLRFVGQRQPVLITHSRRTAGQRRHHTVVGGSFWRRLRSPEGKTRVKGVTLLKRKRVGLEDVERFLQPPATPGYSIVESSVGGEAATYVCVLLNNTTTKSQKQQTLPLKITLPCVRCCETHTKGKRRSSNNSCSLKTASLSPFMNTRQRNKTDNTTEEQQQHITNITVLQQQKNKREQLSYVTHTRNSGTGSARKNNVAMPLVPLRSSWMMSRCYNNSGSKSTPTAASDINTEVSTTATTAGAHSPIDSCCGIHGEDEEDEDHNPIKEKKASQESDFNRDYYDSKTVLDTTTTPPLTTMTTTTTTTTNNTTENCEFCLGTGTLIVEISGVRLFPSVLRKSQRLWGIYYRLSGAKQTLLWSHDSRTDIGYLHSSSLLLCCHLGVNVFVYDYPGYGCSFSFKRATKMHTSNTSDTIGGGGSCSSPVISSHNRNTAISTSNSSNNLRLPFSLRWGVFSRDMNGRNTNNVQAQQQQIDAGTDTLAKIPDTRQQQQEPCHLQSPDTSLTCKNIPPPLFEYLLEKQYLNNNDSNAVVQQQGHYSSVWLPTTPTAAEGIGYVSSKQEETSPLTTPASVASPFQRSAPAAAAPATPGGASTSSTLAETSPAIADAPGRRVNSTAAGPADTATGPFYASGALKLENEEGIKTAAPTERAGQEGEKEGWSRGAPLITEGSGGGEILRGSHQANADDAPDKCLSANGGGEEGKAPETAGCVREGGGSGSFALRRVRKREKNLWAGKHLERSIVAAYKWLIAEQNTKPCDIYVFGEGLGVAATLMLLKKLSRQQRLVQRKLYKHMRSWYLHAPHTAETSVLSQSCEGFDDGTPSAPVSQKKQQQQQQPPPQSPSSSPFFQAAATGKNAIGVNHQIPPPADAVQPSKEEGEEKQQEKKQQQGMMDDQKKPKPVRLSSSRRLPGVSSVLRRRAFVRKNSSASDSTSSSIRISMETTPDEREEVAKYHVLRTTRLKSNSEGGGEQEVEEKQKKEKEKEEGNVSPPRPLDGSLAVNGGDRKPSLKKFFIKAVKNVSLFSRSSDVSKLQSKLIGGILLVASPDGGKVASKQVSGHDTLKRNIRSWYKMNKKSGEKEEAKTTEMRSAHVEDLKCHGKSPVLCGSGYKSSTNCSSPAQVPSMKGSSSASRQPSKRIFFLPAPYFRQVIPSASSREKLDGHSPENDGCCWSTKRGCCRYTGNRCSIECSYFVSYPLSMDARSQQQCCCCGGASHAAPVDRDAVVSADAAAFTHKFGSKYYGGEQYCHRHHCSMCGETARDNKNCRFAWQSKHLLQRRLKWVTADAIETRVRRLSAAPLLLLQPANISYADVNEDQQHQQEMDGGNSPVVKIALPQSPQEEQQKGEKTVFISSEHKEKHMNSRELLGWGSNNTVNTSQSAVQTSLLNCMVEFLQHNAEHRRLLNELSLGWFTYDGDHLRQKANNSCAQDEGYTRKEDDERNNNTKNGEDNERKRFGNHMKGSGGDFACPTEKTPSDNCVKTAASQRSLRECYSDGFMKDTQTETKGTSNKALLPLQNWLRRGLMIGNNDTEPHQEQHHHHESNSFPYPVKKNQEKSGNSSGRGKEDVKSGGRRYFLRGKIRGMNAGNGGRDGDEPETAAEEEDDETKEKPITRPARKKCDSSSDLAGGSESEKKNGKRDEDAAKGVEDPNSDVTARPETASTVKREVNSGGGISQGDGQRLKKLHSRRGLKKRIEHQEHKQQLARPVQKQQQQHEHEHEHKEEEDEEELSSSPVSTTPGSRSRLFPFTVHANNAQLNSNKAAGAVAKDGGGLEAIPPPPGDGGGAAAAGGGGVSADRDDHYNGWKSDNHAEVKENDEQHQFHISSSKCSDHGERKSEGNDSTTPSAHISTPACDGGGHRRRYQKRPSKKSGRKHNDRRSSMSSNDSLARTENEQNNDDSGSHMTEQRLGGLTQNMRITSKKHSLCHL